MIFEAAKLENNIIIRNAVYEDIHNEDIHKALFTKVVRHGLELPQVNFTISQYDNCKFLKVILNKKDDKFSIIKNASS